MNEQIVVVGIKRLAAVCGCGRNTMYLWIRKKGFPAWKEDGVWRGVPDDIKVWLRARREAQEKNM